MPDEIQQWDVARDEMARHGLSLVDFEKWVAGTNGHEQPADEDGRRPLPICWPDFWKRDHPGEEWLIEPVIPKHRQTALWAPQKLGKSLITLELAVAVAAGTPALDQPASPPAHVVYMDYEMTEDDLEERLSDFGLGPDTDLEHLHYYLLPTLPPLDTPDGAHAVLEIIDRHQATLLVIDTMSRVTLGEENSADTYRNFYRLLGLPLKARQVALLRLDHAGKNPDLGQRGSSAKGDDVDLVWQLKRTDTGLQLVRQASRMSWVPEQVNLTRHEDPWLRHTTTLDMAWPAGTEAVAKALHSLGAGLQITRRAACDLLRANGHQHRDALVAKALKYRKWQHPDPGGLL